MADLDLDLTVVTEYVRPGLELPAEVHLESLIRHVLRAEQAAGPWEVAIAFVDDDRLRRMHDEFMGIDEPTDVMTFEHDADDGEPGRPVQGGDIVISLDRASEHAAEGGNGAAREVLFLVVHGVLHLSGWTDGSDADRAAMLDRGDALLASWEREQTPQV